MSENHFNKLSIHNKNCAREEKEAEEILRKFAEILKNRF